MLLVVGSRGSVGVVNVYLEFQGKDQIPVLGIFFLFM